MKPAGLVRRLAPALSALLAACAASWTLEEFDALARTHSARTIVLAEDLSLYSPYDPQRTHEYVELFRAQRAEVFALLEVEGAAPTLVELEPNEGLGASVTVEGNGIRVHGLSTEPHGGLLGYAPGNRVVLAVDPPQTIELADGRRISGGMAASMFASTIRHELAHVAVFLRGIEDGGWLHEGVAHAVELAQVADGRLLLEPPPEQLTWAARIPREQRSLATLADWRQTLPPTDDDRRARLLAFSLTLFLLERDGAPLAEALPRLATIGRHELAALEPEWSAWLERFAPPPATER